MKKILISLLLLVPLVSGCANVDTRININDDYSASVVTSLTYQGDLSNSTDALASSISSNYKTFIDSMYQVENAYGAKLSTITAEKSVDNLRKKDLDLSSLGFSSNLPSKKFIEVKKNFIITSYNIDCTYDLPAQIKKFEAIKKTSEQVAQTQSTEDNSSLSPEYYHEYGDQSELEPAQNSEFDMAANMDESAKQLSQDDAVEAASQEEQANKEDKFTTTFSIKVPSFASFNNADSISGNVYTWNLKEDEPTNIKLQYVQYSAFAIWFVIIVMILLLVLFVGRIKNRDSQKRIDNIDNIV